ncbi:hypothetical protein H5410_044061 [Solanum commersonii]|uniref:Uncharacterized protein n=1 Tax=Solanum commersonii TaxID=4109 RepID=A0A9J5XYX2_SOLCO|nr:hypothetical protein H5410_044061 [Solanum commersonii]
MGIITHSSLRLNSSARSTRSCCGRLGNVWITGYTTISIRSGKCLNIPSSLLSCVSLTSIDINSSSVSASDSACATPSPTHLRRTRRSSRRIAKSLWQSRLNSLKELA